MRKFALALSLSSAAFLLQGADTAAERLSDASKVFSEIMATPDKGIPQDLLEKAQCIIIVPGMKQAGFVVGGKYGRGFATCRKTGDGWGAPAAERFRNECVARHVIRPGFAERTRQREQHRPTRQRNCRVRVAHGGVEVGQQSRAQLEKLPADRLDRRVVEFFRIGIGSAAGIVGDFVRS